MLTSGFTGNRAGGASEHQFARPSTRMKAAPDTLAAWYSYSVQPRPVRLFAGDHFLFGAPDPGVTLERI
jgi:hypothetical protein